MKSAIITLSALTVLISSSVQVDERADLENSLMENTYACVWFPLCDKELYSPVAQPKDSKTETQDAKDEKVA